MKKVTIGLIGSGFAATLHGDAYKKVYGIDVNIKAVASPDPQIEFFCKKYNIPQTYSDYRDMLNDPEIDVIDICTPPYLHVPMIKDALSAGKHVICEKPLTGFFGDYADHNVGHNIPKSLMYKKVLEELDELRKIIESSNKLFMYAENFVYAPTIRKSVELLKAKKSKILFMKGEESHCGSHAQHAAYWKFNGGGSFIRQGCHPLSAILYLKSVEAAVRGEVVAIKSVVGDVGVTQSCLTEDEKKYITSRPVDVEDLANVIITFTDGTKANVIAGDMVVGGVRNIVEVFTNEGVYLNNITPNDNMFVYNIDAHGLDDIYFTEKVETKTGWQNICIDEEIVRGYVGEFQDFMECVATGRQPQSGFELAYNTTKTVYAAYLSAEEGRRVDFT